MSQANFDRFVAENANALVRTAYLIVGDLRGCKTGRRSTAPPRKR